MRARVREANRREIEIGDFGPFGGLLGADGRGLFSTQIESIKREIGVLRKGFGAKSDGKIDQKVKSQIELNFALKEEIIQQRNNPKGVFSRGIMNFASMDLGSKPP